MILERERPNSMRMTAGLSVVVFALCCRLGGVSSQVVRRGKCPQLPRLEGFDPAKMVGTWYLQYVYYACAQTFVKCSVCEMTKVEEDGWPALAFVDRFYDDTTGESRIRHSLELLDHDDPSLFFDIVTSNRHNDTLDCRYVSTGDDYEYFIIYCCEAHKDLFKYENFGVRTRDRRPDGSLLERIKAKTMKLGIDWDFALPVSQECEEDPPMA